MHVRFRWVRTTSLMRTSTTAACCMIVCAPGAGAFALSAVRRPRILHPQSLRPRALFESLSNHDGCAIKAVQSRSHNQGRTIKAAAKAAHSRPHTQASMSLAQNRSLRGQDCSLKAARPTKAGARLKSLAQHCSSHTIQAQAVAKGSHSRPHTQASRPLKVARSKSLGSLNKAARSRALAQPRPLAQPKPTT